MHTHPSTPKPSPQSTGGLFNKRAIADVLALALVLLALLLRTHQLAQESLWLDEAFSVWMSEQPLPDLLSWTVRIDQHPPLYSTILRVWTLIDGSHTSPTARAFWVRLPSAFWSTLSVAVAYTLGRRFAGRKGGLLAALLLALSPFHVWSGQEARMYALLTLNASLAMLGLVRLLNSPRLRPPRTTWILYILFTAAALWTHNTAVLFWAAANLYVLGLLGFSRWRRAASQETEANLRLDGKNPVSLSLRQWLLAQLAILFLWSPWLAPFCRQAAGVDREFWLPAPTWSALAGALNDFLSAYLPQQIAWLSLAWLAASLLLVSGIYALRKTYHLLALPVILFVTPMAGELLVSLRRPIFYARTLIWATLPFYLLLAVGAACASSTGPGSRARRQAIRKIAALLALGMLIAANTRSLRNYYTKTQEEAWDQAAAHVSQGVQPGDLILFNAAWAQLPFDFYFDPPVPVVQRGLPVDLFERGVLEPKMTEQDLPYLESLLQDHSQVWLIYSHNWYTDPQGLIPDALAERVRLVERQHFRGIEVHLYRCQ